MPLNPVYTTDKLRVWGTDIDPGAIAQSEKVAQLPILAGPVALMPDAHVGIGATVGTVIATRHGIIPAAVGVDLGCGMVTSKLACDLKTFTTAGMDRLLHLIGRAVPAGMAENRKEALPEAIAWLNDNPPPNPLPLNDGLVACQLGTLGSGNHFIEVCTDKDDSIWVVLHSGSRGVGNRIANKHIKIAKEAFGNLDSLPDPDLAWLEEGTDIYDRYIEDMLWAQRYAFENRVLMMQQVLREIGYWHTGTLGHLFPTEAQYNCHHNFAQVESVWGWNDEPMDAWITRKGAIAAYNGQHGIIPGSMGTGTYISLGRGDLRSYRSSSHGAGRRLSRGQARRTLSVDTLNERMNGITWQSAHAEALLDEHADAYKDIDQVMRDQADLTRPLYNLRAILNYKGVETLRRKR